MDLARAAVRIARPSRDLTAARRFWVDGLGLHELWRSGPEVEGGHALLMVGHPAAQWHLELVDAPRSHAQARPTQEDLLVLYLGEARPADVVSRIEQCGGIRVASANPYWERDGVTVLDPDGYRLVLTARRWP